MDLSDKSALQALVHVSPRALAKVKCARGSGTRLGTGNMTACSASLTLEACRVPLAKNNPSAVTTTWNVL